MGTYRIGILGSFSGKVGTVIGSSWNGIHYMRSLPRPSSKPATAAQELVRAKFALATSFVSPMRALFEIGYKSVVGKTGANAALAEVISAISGPLGALIMNYDQILISKGSLIGPANGGATAGTGSVVLNWDDNSASGNAKATDLAVTLVYNPARSQSVYSTAGALRPSGTQTVTVPANFSGEPVQVWLAFISADGKTVSTSVFAGMVTVV